MPSSRRSFLISIIPPRATTSWPVAAMMSSGGTIMSPRSSHSIAYLIAWIRQVVARCAQWRADWRRRHETPPAAVARCLSCGAPVRLGDVAIVFACVAGTPTDGIRRGDAIAEAMILHRGCVMPTSDREATMQDHRFGDGV